MSEIELVEKIKLLPEEQKKQLEAMVEEILHWNEASSLPAIREPGFAKGLIDILPGFDDPIEGMEEYM